MRKYISRAMAVLAVASMLVCVCVSTSPAVACDKCNTSNTNRRCGKCGSSRLFTDGASKYVKKNGHDYLRTWYKCQDCGHTTVRDQRTH